MVDKSHILFSLIAMAAFFCHNQRAEAGFLDAQFDSANPGMFEQIQPNAALHHSGSRSGSDQGSGDNRTPASLVKVSEVPSGSASSTGTGVSTAGGAFAPAALTSITTLSSACLQSYLKEFPRLRISNPCRDGILRPPIG